MFKQSDVPFYTKSLSLNATQEIEWLTIANNTLQRELGLGTELLRAERIAILTACEAFKEKKDPTHLSRDLSFVDKPIKVSLAKVGTDEFQQVLAVGYFFNDWYGELIFTKSFIDALVLNWKNKALGTQEPYLDTEHDHGISNGWVLDMEARDDGLYIKWDFTTRGKELVASKLYKYFSSWIDVALDISTGKRTYPVFFGAALTNNPALNIMSEVHLEKKGSTGSPSETVNEAGVAGNKEHAMDLEKILEAINGLSEADRIRLNVQLSTTKKPDVTQEQILQLSSENAVLKTTVTELSTSLKEITTRITLEHKNAVIKEAIEAGRIIPADKKSWEDRYDAAPKVVEEILNNLPKAVDLSTHGSGEGTEITLSTDDVEAAKNLGISVEEYKATIKGGK